MPGTIVKLGWKFCTMSNWHITRITALTLLYYERLAYDQLQKGFQKLLSSPFMVAVELGTGEIDIH